MFQEIVIDSEDIKNYFHQQLLERGFIPTEDETIEIADIAFDYLVTIGLIEDIENY